MNDNKVNIVFSDNPNRQTSVYEDVDALEAMVQKLFSERGLGRIDKNAPLRDIIEPGMTVLLKPNWVFHENLSGLGNDCLVTHPNLIIATLKEVLKARPSRVIIGDAPIQACDFEKLVPEDWRTKVKALAGCPVDFIDFRRTILHSGNFAAGQDLNMRDEGHYILFDLGRDSLLEPVSTSDNRFRITCYDPDILKQHHLQGKHCYLLCREPFEADVIINMPKLKTHKKAGLTAALKNIVGINGNKEYLPHHRTGGVNQGGDCYPGFSLVKSLVEQCLDKANRSIGSQQCSKWLKRSSVLLKIQGKIGNQEIEGGWYGNDTVWRMTLDLNRLLLYGRTDGTLSDTPLRKVYSLTDALVSGEGDGPLAPHPVELNALTFAESSPFADLVHAALMRFDYRKLPTIREAFGNFRYPLTSLPPDACQVVCNGKVIPLADLSRDFGKQVKASSGWRGHIEQKGGAEV
jgi:uncharacterized protein (DUF362 family)